MTLSERIIDDVDTVFFITDDFARSVTHYAGGTGAGSTVTVIVKWSDPTPMLSDGGKEVRLSGTLYVPVDITCLKTDKWTIDGNDYQCVTVGDADGGIRTVHIRRCEIESRSRLREIL